MIEQYRYLIIRERIYMYTQKTLKICIQNLQIWIKYKKQLKICQNKIGVILIRMKFLLQRYSL